MAKLLKALACFLAVLLAVGLVAGPRIALAFLIGFVGLAVALRNGYFRTISSEQFVLYDYQGRKRAKLAPAAPPPGHVIGADWDPSPGLELYYRTGEKAVTLGVDFHNGENAALFTLFRDSGPSVVCIANGPLGQGISARNAPSNREYELHLDNAGKLTFVDGAGKRIEARLS